jgi:hypothetical protein
MWHNEIFKFNPSMFKNARPASAVFLQKLSRNESVGQKFSTFVKAVTSTQQSTMGRLKLLPKNCL